MLFISLVWECLCNGCDARCTFCLICDACGLLYPWMVVFLFHGVGIVCLGPTCILLQQFLMLHFVL